MDDSKEKKRRKSSELERMRFVRFPDFKDFNKFLELSKIAFEEELSRKHVYKETLDDFDPLYVLGSGAYGEVALIRRKDTDQYFAIKAMEKERIVKMKQEKYVKSEKSVLECLNSPLAIYLEYYFQDNDNIYLVMPFVPAELFDVLLELGKFDEEQAKFYASQVVLALEHLHHLDLIYRDLKPENILIDRTGYIKLADFGFCKRLCGKRTYSLCGTPDYLAPEVLMSRGYGPAADWWAVGVLVYEFVSGNAPFRGTDAMILYENIINNKYKMPKSFSSELKDLIKSILNTDLTARLGNLRGGANDIKYHKWFRTIGWLSILNRTTSPPFKPKMKDPRNPDDFNTGIWQPLRKSDKNMYVEEFADM